MTKIVIRRIAICIKYLLISLITLNFIMFLCIPVNNEYILKNKLQFSKSSGYGHDKLLGDFVDLEGDVTITSIYNFDYYNGYIYINNKKYNPNMIINKKYNIKGRKFIPRSLIGKFYVETKYFYEFIKPDYSEYYMNITDFEGHDAEILIRNRDIIKFTVYKDGEIYAIYEALYE